MVQFYEFKNFVNLLLNLLIKEPDYSKHFQFLVNPAAAYKMYNCCTIFTMQGSVCEGVGKTSTCINIGTTYSAVQ